MFLSNESISSCEIYKKIRTFDFIQIEDYGEKDSVLTASTYP